MWEIKSAKSKETRQIWIKLKDQTKTKKNQTLEIHDFLYTTEVGLDAHEARISIPSCVQDPSCVKDYQIVNSVLVITKKNYLPKNR